MLTSNPTDDCVHFVATVPPPPGESDAYSAPTRVQLGPLADMSTLMRCGEDVEQDVVLPISTVSVAADREPRRTTGNAGTLREWLTVVGLAVVGTSAMVALAMSFP